ncbi:histidine kinase [Hoeflea sp. BAL378]|uniref:putative bifunctional diguanylate cyclase/phosphodiesterase n=1 Tax=Hoeflea sp. BAL378 TaxID=1547437 RepID=UPI0005132157|nr:EAL domain-containing protein [Hoeflea sp. BAL378]KGF69299.1 histidine kinase [Hoeflea sp. BAL378]
MSRLFSVPGDNPDLLKAQFEVFSSQVPLMYSIVLINAWALALNFMDVAPAWISLHLPAGFTLVCGLRLMGWWRARHIVPTAAAARQALTQTNLFALLLTTTLTAWALALYPYGDAQMQANIAFFIGISGLGVIICLQQLPSAALIAAVVINVIFVMYFSLAGVAAFAGMAVNLLLVSVALLLVVSVQFRHFSGAVSARRKLEAVSRENFRLANLDSLTGLPNRRQFFSHLDETFAAANGRRLAVGIIDLDGFKPVNDLYGHKVGDGLLVEVGRRLSALMHANVHIARLGGDEFALTVADCPEDADLLTFGERICTALRKPFVLPEATVQLSGSIGFAVFPELADSAQELYERADYALYQGKRSNRGHAVLFSGSHVVEIEQEKRIEQALSHADLDREIVVFFQPIVDIQNGRTVAFEALARWTSPVLGPVPPGQFIPVAERIGLIGQLTRVLLRKALATAADWPEDVVLSFNLSTHDVSSSDGAVAIVGIILASGIDPKRLDFEITETAMMYDFVQAKAAIDMLKALGCGIALDDFGTGYSSLSQLHALPLTKIKIDRSFVTDLDKNPASFKIVKSLLALSSDMGLRCVTEGVETEEELATLRKLGGQFVQGYLLSRPIAEDQVAGFLQSAAAEAAGNGHRASA